MADLSSQAQDTTKDTAHKEQESPGAFNGSPPSLALIVPIAVNESVPRSGAGVVNDAGDVLDDSGKTVGKIADTDNLKNLVGNTVNTSGDVVDSSGDVLGKTLPIGQGKPEDSDSHDEEKSEYTTQAKDNKSGDAAGSVTGAVSDTAKKATDAVSDTAGAVGETGKEAVGDVTDTKSEATSQAADTNTPAETPKAPEVKDETPDVKSEQSQSQDQKDSSLEDRDAPAEAGDKLKEVAPEPVKETTDKAEDTAKDTTEDAKDTTEDAKDTTEEAKDIPEEAKEDATSKVDEQDVPKPEDVEDKLQEKTEEAKDDVPKSEAAEVPEGDAPKSQAPGDEIPSDEVPEDDGDKSKAGDDLKSVAPGEDAAGVTDEVQSKAADGEEAAEDKVAEGEKAAEDLPEDAKSKAAEGEETTGDLPEDAQSKAAEGEKAAEDLPEDAQSKAAEGEKATDELPEDAKDKVAEGEEATGDLPEDAQSKAAEGEEATGDLPEDAQSKAAEGQETAEGKVAEGEEATSDLPEDAKDKAAEGEEAAEDKVAEGEKATDELPEDAKDKVAEGEEATGDLPEDAQSKAAEGEETAEGKVAEGEETAEGKVAEGEEATEVTEEAKDKAAEGEEAAEDKVAEGEEATKDKPLDFTILKGTTVDKEGNLVNEKGDKLGKVTEGELKQLVGLYADDQGIIWDKTGKQLGKAEPIPEWDREQKDFSILKGTTVDKEGNLVNDKGDKLGRVVEGELKQLVGLYSDDQGIIWDKTGKQLGKAEPIPEWDREQKDFSILKGTTVDKEGNLVNDKGHLIGRVTEGEIKQLVGLSSDDQGIIWDKTGKQVGKAEPLPEWERGEQKDFSLLKGTVVDKNGNLVNEKGHLFGKVIEGEIKQLIGLTADDQGIIWDKTGKQVGKAEPLPEWERGEQKDFSILKGAVVDKEGGLVNDKGDTIGKVSEGEVRQLVGLKSDENGKIWRDGKVVGQAEPLSEWDRVQKKDRSILKGTKVNKVGKLVDANGTVVGKVVEGDLKELLGKRADENGDIWNDSGEVIGKGEPVSVSEREEKSAAPFEHFPGAKVESDGRVMYQGEQVGEVIEGDAKQLKGSEVDEDGDILDRRGNSVGKAKRWEAPEEEAEKPIDNSALAGKRVNKAGNLVSESGEIYGRVIEGDVQKLIGRMSDRDGNIRSESGDIIGKAELVSEGERGGKKEGPFAQLKNCTVSKDGKIVNSAGETVGRLISGDAKALVGRAVDDDGEITDSNGNVIGKAERWEEEQKEQKHNPLAGRKVNREGNVVDADGNIIGKLTSGELLDCSGKEVDEDGDVFNQKGTVIGHVSLIEDIPKEEEPEPEEPEGETEEERIKREEAEAEEKKTTEEAEKNKKLAQQLAYQIEQTLERLRPICKSINDKISAAEAQKPEERDEEELVRQVKPLIEDGGKLLTETNGIIRGLDPDGRIARNAKQKTAGGEATPEEAHLANLLKELSTEIQSTIEEGKRKLEGMPHAKKEINPLWGLLAEPLAQIIAAVGLLLSGVLGLVGKILGPILGPLLNGLGLGGLLDGVLGGLGLKKILGGLGLGNVVGTVTGTGK